MTTFFVLVVFVGYLGITIYLANVEETKEGQTATLQTLLYLGIGMIVMFALFVLFLAFAGPDMAAQAEAQGEQLFIPEISGLELAVGLIIAALAALIAFIVINSYEMRMRLRYVIGSQGDFSAKSAVHTTSVVLCMLVLTAQVISFVASGGADDMAAAISEEGVSPTLPVFQAAIQIAAAFLGVGYLIRRDLALSLRRLGLRIPTRADLGWGFGGGLLLYVVPLVYGIFLAILVQMGVLSEESITAQNQAADSLAQAFATLPLALILSVSAAVGEEIFFRGALQPIFGNILTSVFFALLHTQSLISPAVIILFFISLGLGWIRERYSTTAAIFAHFVYNFVQLLLLILISSSGVV